MTSFEKLGSLYLGRTGATPLLYDAKDLTTHGLIVGMTGGGPVQSTQVLALWSYTSSFTNHEFGIGNAIATVLLGVSLVLVVPYMIWTMKGEDE